MAAAFYIVIPVWFNRRRAGKLLWACPCGHAGPGSYVLWHEAAFVLPPGHVHPQAGWENGAACSNAYPACG